MEPLLLNMPGRPRKGDLICFALSLLLAAGLAFFYKQAVFGVGLLALTFLTMVTFIQVEIALFCALVWPFCQYLLTRDLKLLPEFFTLIDECCLFAIVLYLAWQLCMGRIRPRFTRFDGALLAFLGVGLLSAALNRNPTVNTVLGLRCYLQYLVLFYALSYLKLSDRFCRLLLHTMLGLVLVQVPLMVLQYFTWTPSSLVNDHADSAYGTLSFGSANMLGMLMLVFIFYLIKMRQHLPALFTGPALVACAFALVISHSKVSFLFLLLLLLYNNLSLIRTRVSLTEIMGIMLGLALLVKIALLVSSDISNLLSRDSFMVLIANQIEDKEGGGRIMYLLLTFTVLVKYAFSPLLGLGPGMYSSYAGISLKSRYLVDILGVDLERRGTRLDPDLIGVLGEYGYLGLLFFSAALAILFLRNYQARLSRSPYWSGYADWFKLFTIVFYLGAFVNGLWQAQYFAVTYWVAAGILNRKYLEASR